MSPAHFIRRVITATFISAAISTSVCAQVACKRPAPKTFRDTATVVLSQSNGFPCTVQLVATGVTLRARPDGPVDDIGLSVARGPDGRFYSAVPSDGRITVWNADGSFLRNVGREGKGPGELARGEKFIDVDVSGRIFVGDNNVRWSMFDSSFRYQNSFSAADIGIGIFQCCAVLDDGSFLTSFGRHHGAFRIVDITNRAAPIPPLVRAFGPVVKGSLVTRPVAYVKGTTFWAGSPTQVAFEYVLEQWSTTGRRLRSIRREVPWLVSNNNDSDASRVGPDMRVLHDAGNGLLFVTIMVPQKSYAALSPIERRERGPGTAVDRSVHNYFEVIDVNAGTVLASVGPLSPSEWREKMPTGFLGGSAIGYRRSEDDDGFRSVHIVEIKLTAR